jgi:ABC-type transport system involved in multi-copper enzyme maturation permease subunit
VIDQIRAELLKIRTTRTTIGLLLGMLALILLFVLLTGLIATVSGLSGRDNERQLFGIGSLSGIFAALAGVLLVSSEYRYGTMRPTILFTPRRSRVLGAKLVAAALGGLAFALIGDAIGWGITYLVLSGRDVAIVLSGRDYALLVAGSLGGGALWGALGAGLGTILRNQVGGIITLVAWGFVVSPLLFGLVPSVGRLMPSYAQNALLGMTTAHLVTPGAGALLLIAWAALLATIGIALTASRDIG